MKSCWMRAGKVVQQAMIKKRKKIQTKMRGWREGGT